MVSGTTTSRLIITLLSPSLLSRVIAYCLHTSYIVCTYPMHFPSLLSRVIACCLHISYIVCTYPMHSVMLLGYGILDSDTIVVVSFICRILIFLINSLIF
jgi:hypothetical protein